MGAVLFIGDFDWEASGWVWAPVFRSIAESLRNSSPDLARVVEGEVDAAVTNWTDMSPSDLRLILAAAKEGREVLRKSTKARGVDEEDRQVVLAAFGDLINTLRKSTEDR